MQRLANELSMSDVGLAKLCRRHEIPVPGRGYWRRLQTGHEPKRPSLPASNKPYLNLIEITFRESMPGQENPSSEVEPTEQPPTILVLEDQAISHPYALRTERSLCRTKSDERGFLLPRKGKPCNGKVSEKSLPRALRIFDAMFRALDERNYVMKWPREENAKLTVFVLDEELQFAISEFVGRKPHTPTQQELAEQKEYSWKSPPKWDYVPSGRLKLEIEYSRYLNIRHMWSDGKRRRLEDCLNAFVAGLALVANRIKQEREEDLRRKREWEEQRKREEERRQRLAEYERKAEVLSSLVARSIESKNIRELVASFMDACKKTVLTERQWGEAAAMIEWSTNHANSLDPLTFVSETVHEFRRCSQVDALSRD
jgi:hypothetical protein